MTSILALIRKEPTSIIIIGDSLSERSGGFSLQEKLGSEFVVYDISVSGRDIPIWLNHKNEILSKKSDIVIVNLGTNDASYYPTELYPSNYNQLVNFLKENHFWKIIVSLVPPTNNPILQSRIATNNEYLRNQYANETIVDLEKLFLNNSNLPLYPIFDDIHPNPIGYEMIGEEYRKTIISLPIQF
ncbi:SGNH/GDSL hydrolase family protein [Leptospira sp. GIMC2001]|uniref:SGNH/GDSL hydrolase family protein n=1 Tax=Leptospira sp. GIMC2001 TaxID=1513297 RepID=UPI00234B9DD3|nr:SGNH/GDSL hydrolase family protein [Leptospira sp. GIMC2001]WCL49582.1 SGNH/GDSL hydrolase family protein [Leptospira sp. GIMC2001]